MSLATTTKRVKFQVRDPTTGSTSYKDFLSGASKVSIASTVSEAQVVDLGEKFQAISTGRLTGKYQIVTTEEYETPAENLDTIASGVGDLDPEDITNLVGYIGLEDENGKTATATYKTMALGTSATLTSAYATFAAALSALITDYAPVDVGASGKYKKVLTTDV